MDDKLLTFNMDKLQEEYHKKYPNGQCKHNHHMHLLRCKGHCVDGTVLCEDHLAAYNAGIIKAPPLRINRDYQSSARKCILVDTDLKPVETPNLNGDLFQDFAAIVARYKERSVNFEHTDKPSSFNCSIRRDIAAPVAPAQEEHGESQEKKA